MTTGSELPPGSFVDRRYRIERVLGRGGFGRTYLAADDRRFGELCVLKEFDPKSQGDSVVAQKLHELFHREATILHQLNHPQIPKFLRCLKRTIASLSLRNTLTAKPTGNSYKSVVNVARRFQELR
ncbi:MAG: hypothetical protein HC769_17440 [Cyanobacteria bacterium CRU_2_1]|nr:hypothetical protein [Cyanobacteria bacterium CRU_2_1]